MNGNRIWIELLMNNLRMIFFRKLLPRKRSDHIQLD